MCAKRDKKPKAREVPSGEKNPKIASEPSLYDDRKAAWRVAKIQLTDPYGWHEISANDASQIKVKLAVFEKNSWKELFVRDARFNHRIQSDQLKCPIARKWMAENMPDQPYLWTLRLSGSERIWGILSEGAYQVLFWDPQHLIWEVPRT
ncbi:hypothetical protein GOB94_09255 [Granulicella sp. 5B5]|uniref:hypothetical protein n=1 Tax=Granulicella sp. 5B5 TaxID=1617967 RepID=UPI0015F76D13|nr:hypothetical protein [Granulicella sp. 5B5]QMV18848.1 hypothetical protein GOB94_09255 [Granulicella sp. 5B5]